jgi:hypothetical protein
MHGTQICDALQRRRLIRFRYKDHLGPTVVEPYVYGENKAGNLVLAAWLVSGETKDVTPPLWRLYRDDEMHMVEVLPEVFRTNRADYKPNDSRFEFIRCRLADPSR